MNIHIRPAKGDDVEQLWKLLHLVFQAGDTYAVPRDIARDEALKLWMSDPRECYVAVEGGRVVGTYFIRTNQQGGGDHVCNCGYVVSETAAGNGIATKLCLHSQERALEIGYKAMQFNFVVASNTRAIRLWQHLGFQVVGRLPLAFRHPREGYIDALVMHKELINTETEKNTG